MEKSSIASFLSSQLAPLNTWPWTNSWLSWIIGSICFPVTVPLIFISLLRRIRWHFRKRGKLQDKVVLITGASSGLGEALAYTFYRAGCRLILASRSKDSLNRVKHDLFKLKTDGPTHPPVVLPLDLSDPGSLSTHAAAALAIHNRIDILINNGGISYRGEVISTTLEVDMHVMTVNYFGQVALTKALLPSMIEHSSGHIVFVSSIQGRIAIPYRSCYSASKHALQAFSDTLRAELHHKNIKVTVVSPGYIKTNISLNAVTGSGDTYGKLDPTTSSGMSPFDVAQKILQAVVLEENELILSPLSPRVAVCIRTFWSNLYFWVMNNRAQRLRHQRMNKNE